MTEIPSSTCECCGHVAPSASYTTYGNAGASSLLCGKCFNEEAALVMGVPAPEPAEFEPLTLNVGARRHTFLFHVYLNPGGLGLRAREHEPRDPEGGYEFSVLVPAGTPSKVAYEKLLEKIRKGIRTKSLTSDRSRLIEDRAVGRFASENLVIDGREVTWEQFREILNCYEGWQFRLEVLDPSDDPHADTSTKSYRSEMSADSIVMSETMGRLKPISFH